LHAVQPIAVTPPGARVHESVMVAEGALWPTAKHSGTAPTTLPSKAVPEYEKVYVETAVESAAVEVAGVHAEQPAKAAFTAPAGQLEKKPDRTSGEAADSAWTVKEMAV